MEGQIIKISSDLYFVSHDNKTYPCKCRGIFRKEHITPVVGDYVLFSVEEKIIEKILPRKNCFQRPKVSNIDQAFIITSLKLPDFSLLPILHFQLRSLLQAYLVIVSSLPSNPSLPISH